MATGKAPRPMTGRSCARITLASEATAWIEQIDAAEQDDEGDAGGEDEQHGSVGEDDEQGVRRDEAGRADLDDDDERRAAGAGGASARSQCPPRPFSLSGIRIASSSHHGAHQLDLAGLAPGLASNRAVTSPSPHHQDPVGQPDGLLERVGDQQDRYALAAEVAHQRVDLLFLGADVEARASDGREAGCASRPSSSAPAPPSAGCRR